MSQDVESALKAAEDHHKAVHDQVKALQAQLIELQSKLPTPEQLARLAALGSDPA